MIQDTITGDGDAEIPYEPIPAASHPELDDDETTSVVGSVYLHMLSEHDRYDALNHEEPDAHAMHQQLHSSEEGDVEDLRFRPAVALANALYGVELAGVPEPVSDLPAQPEPAHDVLSEEVPALAQDDTPAPPT